MVEHKKGRVWAYRVPIGINAEASWLPKRIIQDWDNAGFKDAMIQLKTDQEPAIVQLQSAIQNVRQATLVPVNTPVGESECNGRVENTIRRVQEKLGALRHQVETNTKRKIQDNAPIMAWMVRWAAELISKYSMGDDGKSPYERIRQERCVVPLVPFGEFVMYLLLKTVRRYKGDPAKKYGVWLGVIERIEEIFIGTCRGVIKCRTVSRLPKGEQWDADVVANMVGTPWEPVPGNQSLSVPVMISEEGEIIDSEADERQPRTWRHDEETGETDGPRVTPHNMHVSRKAIANYGQTHGCPGCDAIGKRGHLLGKLGYNHNSVCRSRIMKEMMDDPEHRRLIQKHVGDTDPGELGMICEEQRHTHVANLKKAIMTIEKRLMEEQLNSCLNRTMMEMLINNMDVAKVYSPPRVAAMANCMGLRAGWSLDLTTCDSDGRAWDFNSIDMRNRPARKLIRDKPLIFIGSPVCSPFSAMNNINYSRMDTAMVQQYMDYGRSHLRFCAKLYKMQIDQGRYFVHEHPQSASSWKESCIKQLLQKEGVQQVVAEQCCYGLKAHDGVQEGPARKSTRFMTNPPCIAKQLMR